MSTEPGRPTATGQGHARPLFPFDNSYADLPDRFYARLAPTPVKQPRLLRLNQELALELGLDPARLASPEGVGALAGNDVPANAASLAMAYAGHQFGSFVPQLGDGRALLLGEVIDRNGQRRDIQLKGSGPTPFSRRGDGRAAIGPVVREYIVSEAMARLGVPTTRSLAAVATGEVVYRDAVLPGAVLTRVAASHIRVGTFQYFAARGDQEGLRLLADHVIARHYPDVARDPNPYRAMIEAVMARQARLVAQWMGIGFIHGVMNTDNASIAGETIDYGPCAFVDTYHPGTVYSSIDHAGRYAFANQPRIAQWNMARLAETLLGLLDTDADAALAKAQALIDGFPALFEAELTRVMRDKLGLATARDDDLGLAQELLARMAEGEADFTLTFRNLSHAAADPANDDALTALFKEPDALQPWLARWRSRIADETVAPAARREKMLAINPAVIPRNHRVEEAIAAALKDDLGAFERLIGVLARPFEELPQSIPYMAPPAPHEVVQQTFCGT